MINLKLVAKAQDELVYQAKQIRECKEWYSDELEGYNQEEIENARLELKMERNVYRGMVKMFSTLSGMEEREIRVEIAKLIEAEDEKKNLI